MLNQYWLFPDDSDHQYEVINAVMVLLDDLNTGDIVRQGSIRLLVTLDQRHEEDLLDLLDEAGCEWEPVPD
jgi:hypothetical protein